MGKTKNFSRITEESAAMEARREQTQNREEAAKNLLAQIAGEKKIPKTISLKPHLIVGDSCKNFAAGFLGNSPIIFVTILILGAIVLVVVLIIRGVKKRSAKKQAKAQNNVPKE